MVWLLLLVAVVVVVAYLVRRKATIPRVGSRVVFISGCDSGIGLRAALQLASEGCEVVAGCLHPRNADPGLLATVSLCVPLDVTSEESVQDAVSTLQTWLRDQGKELWCLVNNAGVCVFGEFAWQTWEQVREQVDVNLLGTMRLTRAILPLLRESRGRIVTITSVNGSVAYPGLSVYCATKFALEGFCDALRLELRPLGVKVLVLAPGDLARATCIMEGHEGRARAMWAGLKDGTKMTDGTRFRRFHQAALTSAGLSSPTRLDNTPLLRDLREAVLGRAPPSRRVSAPRLHRICYALLIALPSALRDAFLSAVVAMVLRFVPDDGGLDFEN